MLVVTMVLVLLMTLIAGIFTGCGKNAGGGLDGTESSGTNADGSAGGGKGRFIESKVALPEEKLGDNTAERYLLQRCRSRRGWNSCVS